MIASETPRQMAGHGNGERAARELGVDSAHLRSMRSGNQAISLKVGRGLGFELRWIKKEKQ